MAISEEMEVDVGCYRGTVATFKTTDPEFPAIICGGSTNIYAWGTNVNAIIGVGYANSFVRAPHGLDTAGILNVSAGASVATNGATGFIERRCDVNFTKIYPSFFLRISGNNEYEQVNDELTPYDQEDYDEKYYAISACCVGSHLVCITNVGTMVAWGLNTNNQCGAGGDTVPLGANQFSGSFLEAAAGKDFTLVIQQDGTLWGMGNNDRGQLGLEEPTQVDTLTQIGESDDWWKISAGANHALALDYRGRLFATGGNEAGQLGLNHYQDRDNFVQVGFDVWSYIAAGNNFSLGCNIFADTTTGLQGWGSNSHGQLGIGSTGGTYPTMQDCTVVVGKLTSIKQIACGEYHSAFLFESDNNIFTTGDDTYGQLANGVVGVNRNTFAAATGFSVPINDNIYQIDCGDSHTSFAIGSAALIGIWGCGKNDMGQCLYDTPSENTGGYFVTGSGHLGSQWYSPACGIGFTGGLRTGGT